MDMSMSYISLLDGVWPYVSIEHHMCQFDIAWPRKVNLKITNSSATYTSLLAGI